MQNSNSKTGNRKYWWRLLHNPFIMILGLAILFFVARAAWNVHKSATTVSLKLSQARSEKERLLMEQKNLSSKIDELSTPGGLESELRMKYRAVKAGESVAVIVGSGTPGTSSELGVTGQESGSGTGSGAGEGGGFWSRVLGLFGL